MALSDPLDTTDRQPDSEIRDILGLCSLIFSGIFVGEVVIKVIAYGLIVGPKAYLKETWNMIDFFIATLGAITDFVPGGADGPIFLRTLRSVHAVVACT